MTLSAKHFPEFFRTINGNDPFRWQIRLVESILDRSRWPDQITAPTGAGKSSVIDIHVFVNAVGATDPTIRPPRRLIAAVDRRALVDSQFDRAKAIAGKLSSPTTDLLEEIRSALQSLRTWRDPKMNDPDAGFDPVALRGGLPISSAWRDDPGACAVICATPAMWGSRALFRGYGASRAARPRDTGTLTIDSVLVLDEAHLNQQLLLTGRRIVELQECVTETLGIPGLQVVETTATPGNSDTVKDLAAIGVTDDDLRQDGPDPTLARRLSTPKTLLLVESAEWPAATASSRRAVATQLAERAVALKATRQRTVGVMVNTVDTAVRVAEILRKSQVAVQLIAGRMRPHDLAQLRKSHPGLFTVAGDDSIDVLVSTQTLEVGVDLDLSALVTELAPGSAIAQRAGRVNRLGKLTDSVVEVLVPPMGATISRDAPPYAAKDLADSRDWLLRRQADPAGLAPWAVARDPGPIPELGRRLLQRLELADTWVLSDTSREPFAEPDLDLWLSDQLDDATDLVSLVVRHDLPIDSSVAMDLLRATPPFDEECFPTRIRDGRDIIGRILAPTVSAGGSEIAILARLFCWRAGSLEMVATAEEIRPGDVLIIDDVHQILTEQVTVVDGSERARDVYDEAAIGAVTRIVRARTEGSRDARVLDAVSEIIAAAPKDTLGRRRSIAEAIGGVVDDIADAVAGTDGDGGSTTQQRLTKAAKLLRTQKLRTEVAIGAPDENWVIPWMVIRDLQSGVDRSLLQVRTASGREMTLDRHAAEVEQRARSIARSLGLGSDLQRALAEAGLHHDDGKADERFQRMLQDQQQPDLAPERLLAKSGAPTAGVSRIASARISPSGWRHEQLSVVIASQAISSDLDRELVLRLVGTSHGHGRGGFRHASEELLPDGTQPSVRTIAEELFDIGYWDHLLESTQERWGAWGCAYLEAILRAADCQMSEEGQQ